MKSKPLRELLEFLFIAGREYEKEFKLFETNGYAEPEIKWREKEKIIKEIESRSKMV